MSGDRARAARLVAEAKKRADIKGSIDYDKLLFGPQRDFIGDTSKWVVAWCSRRAGKSWGVALKMLKVAFQYPGCTVLYITNTRRQAKRIMWDLTLLPMMRELGIPYHPNQNELQITLSNNSRILLGGANDASEIETYRGIKTPLVVIDEAQSFRSFLAPMIDQILNPALIDYAPHGQIYMTGTPNAACFGYFHDACHDLRKVKGWSKHHWTIMDNPHIPNAEEELRRDRERMGMKETDPRYLREWLGTWIRDAEGMVFNLEDHLILPSLPAWDDWGYVLGMDFGFKDDTAFVVNGFSVKEGRMCTVESYARPGMTPSDVAEEVTQLTRRYEFDAIVGDVGGLGKGYAEEMLQRWGIPVEAAEKSDKPGAIELLNGDLRRGRVLVYEPENVDLIHDARMLQWNYDKVDVTKYGGKISRLKLQIDDRTPDHLPDAWLYAYRRCLHYLHTEPAMGLTEGSAEWWDAYEEDLWAQQGRPVDPYGLEHETLPTDEEYL